MSVPNKVFEKLKKEQMLTNLAAKLWAIPQNLDQNLYLKNDPQSVYFKVDFITFCIGPFVLVQF